MEAFPRLERLPKQLIDFFFKIKHSNFFRVLFSFCKYRMITYWFPTGIYHSDYDSHNSLKECILSHLRPKEIDPNEKYHSWGFWEKNVNRGLQDVFSIQHPEISKFKTWIENQVSEFSKSYGCENSYEAVQSWINIYDRGDFQESHVHIGFDFSGIYFIQAPEDSGKVVFENPLNIYNMRPLTSKKTTDLYTESAIYAPVEGRLILFRSNLRHGVFPHNNNEPRISIAFNLISR